MCFILVVKRVAQLRLLAFPFMLAALAVASCGRGTRVTTDSAQPVKPTTEAARDDQRRRPCVNLNTATAEELMTLPGVGEVIAKRVIDYHERHGRFRRPEEIIIIEGFSERKYRAIAGSICVE